MRLSGSNSTGSPFGSFSAMELSELVSRVWHRDELVEPLRRRELGRPLRRYQFRRLGQFSTDIINYVLLMIDDRRTLLDLHRARRLPHWGRSAAG